MKLALLGAMITKVSGTEFEDGQKILKVSLEDGFSFNLPEGSPLVKKLGPGREIDLTYSSAISNKTDNGFVFNNLRSVKVTDIRDSEVETLFVNVKDVERGEIPYNKVGSTRVGGTALGTGDIGKV